MWIAPVYDLLLAPFERSVFAPLRAELLADARGDVAEIGAGTGANLPHYPPGLTSLTLTEPDPAMRAQLIGAARSHGNGSVTATVADAAAEGLPFEDASLDCVVSTLALCSVADLKLALSEARRVLRPGGHLLYLEHVGDAPGTSRRRWQERLDRPWSALAGGCRLNRCTGDALRGAGFSVDHERRVELRWVPSVLGLWLLGSARNGG